MPKQKTCRYDSSLGLLTKKFVSLIQNAPEGVLDLADINLFVSAFQIGLPDADLAAPQGVFDLADVVAFVASFTSGCP